MILSEKQKNLLQVIGKFCPQLGPEIKKIKAYEDFLLLKTIKTNLAQANGKQNAQQYRELIKRIKKLLANTYARP
jgi:hypothetical protein